MFRNGQPHRSSSGHSHVASHIATYEQPVVAAVLDNPTVRVRAVRDVPRHHRVDLWGRLSNPPPFVETLAEQGPAGRQRSRKAVADTRNRAPEGSLGSVSEEEGRLSNPVQRRLSESTIDDLVSAYLAGSSIDSLAAKLGVNRTTIISHLDRSGIERRKSVRKMTDRSVRQAAKCYEAGESLKVVAARFGVDAKTLAREFRRACVPIRRRRGWQPPT